MGSQRGEHDLAIEHAHTNTTRKVSGGQSIPAGGLWEAVAHRVTSCRTSTLVERFKIHKHLSQERIMTPEKELTLIFTFSN